MNRQAISAQVMTILIVPNTKQVEKHDQNKEIMMLLHQHLEALFYNVASTISVMALLNGRNKIHNKDVDEIKHYIRKQCQMTSSHQSGGSMPSDYFGYNLENYQASNTGNEPIVSQVDFNNGIARQAMGPQSGGGKNILQQLHHFAIKTASVKKYVKAIFAKNGVSISKTALHALLVILDVHINCLVRDIKHHCGESLTVAKVKKVLALKRHAVFN